MYITFRMQGPSFLAGGYSGAIWGDPTKTQPQKHHLCKNALTRHSCMGVFQIGSSLSGLNDHGF